ncbi:MAG: ABC transporter ATP-binding protein [Clostridia bacterium]|nr:ABC transporter ATP-binding protein [Clostridia bacterium]MBQ7339127.1 ABC transporter ATP-binding protein [Clostridia bacterium]
MGKSPYQTVEKPRNLKDVPRFLRELLGGFFERLFYIFKLVWETNPAILFGLLLVTLFNGVLPVVGSLITQRVLNELQAGYLGEEELSTAVFMGSALFTFLVAMFAYRIFNTIVSCVNTAVTRIAGERVVHHVKHKIMVKAKELDMASFDSPAFYEKLENANREAGNRPIQILSATFSMVSSVISLVSYIVILATAPGMWWSVLVIAAVSLPSAIINMHYRRKNFQYMRRRSKERRQMNYYSDIMVNKDMAKEIRMFGLSDLFTERYDTVFEEYYTGIRKLILAENAWHVVTFVVRAVVNCLFYAMIAFRVYLGQWLIGDYSLLTGALGSVSSQVGTLINLSAQIYEGTLFIDNLIVFMKEERTVLPSIPAPRHVQHGQPHTIEFEHVSFRYPGTEHDVLSDVSMTIAPGETLVLVGLNGAGKTTLLKLLTRLYDPTGGRILLDGYDLREYDVDDLYRMFGIIFQDFGRYAVTVEENIRFGDISRDRDDERMRSAAQASGASDFVERLDGGYQTPLMRIFEIDGTELSGGQWQKLAIARAFYGDGDVIILDEPTAALDPMAEQEIYNQFDRLRKDKTTIFVSHRLSSATVASKILVLEYGRIIEEGNHAALMAKRGRYWELFSTQASRYIAEGEHVLEDAPPPRHAHPPHLTHEGEEREPFSAHSPLP